jgi:hypothetical protein
LVEHIGSNPLYSWFVGLTRDDAVWDHSTFSANRAACRMSASAVPLVASKDQGSAIGGRITRYTGYRKSLKTRKRIEEVFGWVKTVGSLRQTKFRGLKKVAA